MPKLGDIAEISAGHAFRGAVVPAQEATARVIQMKDVDPERGVGWASLEFSNPPGRKEPDWLRPGDLIFQARGRQNFAVHLAELPPGQIVCTQHFFVIRVADERFGPAFVAWQLNQALAQEHFDRNAAGGKNRNITLATLKSTPIASASVEDQAKIATLMRLVQREKRLIDRFLANRKRQISALAEAVLKCGDTE